MEYPASYVSRVFLLVDYPTRADVAAAIYPIETLKVRAWTFRLSDSPFTPFCRHK